MTDQQGQATSEFPLKLLRRTLRFLQTHKRRMEVCLEVLMLGPVPTLNAAVARVAMKHRLSERYVWRTVKPYRRLHKRIMTYLEQEAARPRRRQPRGAAWSFLVRELRNGPQRAKDILDKALASGIATTTLRRAYRHIGNKPTRRGGRHGHWVWELSPETKKIFRIEAQRLPDSERS
jgi:hypothetical protein